MAQLFERARVAMKVLVVSLTQVEVARRREQRTNVSLGCVDLGPQPG